MTGNPVARALADARNRRRIVPDKRREEQERLEISKIKNTRTEKESL